VRVNIVRDKRGDLEKRTGLRRFIRSFGIVQSASLKLISLHVAFVSGDGRK
jgi:hypothetical protein